MAYRARLALPLVADPLPTPPGSRTDPERLAAVSRGTCAVCTPAAPWEQARLAWERARSALAPVRSLERLLCSDPLWPSVLEGLRTCLAIMIPKCFPRVSFIQALILLMRAQSSCLNHIPETPPPNITLGFKFQYRNSGDTHRVNGRDVH